MAIQSSDMKYYLTGGGANSDPNASLGGTISATQVGSSLHNIFDRVSPEEAVAGDTEYRAIDVKNTHGSETLYDAFLWISLETTSTFTTVALAYEAGTQTVANESTAPTAVTFTTPLSKAAGIALGDIAPGGTRRIWLRRTVTALAPVLDNDNGSLTVGGSTGQ